MSGEPDFISRQTIDSRRFYLDLDPPMDCSLSVVCGGVEKTQSDYVIERSDFPYFGIELVTEGYGRLQLAENSFGLSRGVAFAYGPGIHHRIENRQPGTMRKYFIDIVGTEAEQLLIKAGLLNGTPVLIGGLAELTDIWEAIGREARESMGSAAEICQLLVRLLLLKLRQRQIRIGQRMPASYATYERVRRYIEAEYDILTTIEQVAEGCDLTPIYVSRLFKKYASAGAYQFLLRMRMNHAADLLASQQMKVCDVAQALGFSDQFQFSRAFKRVFGIPPSKLVERSENGNGG